MTRSSDRALIPYRVLITRGDAVCPYGRDSYQAAVGDRVPVPHLDASTARLDARPGRVRHGVVRPGFDSRLCGINRAGIEDQRVVVTCQDSLAACHDAPIVEHQGVAIADLDAVARSVDQPHACVGDRVALLDANAVVPGLDDAIVGDQIVRPGLDPVHACVYRRVVHDRVLVSSDDSVHPYRREPDLTIVRDGVSITNANAVTACLDGSPGFVGHAVVGSSLDPTLPRVDRAGVHNQGIAIARQDSVAPRFDDAIVPHQRVVVTHLDPVTGGADHSRRRVGYGVAVLRMDAISYHRRDLPDRTFHRDGVVVVQREATSVHASGVLDQQIKGIDA